MTEQTSNHGWTIPTPGSDAEADQWGQLLNDFFDGELDPSVILTGDLASRPAAGDTNLEFYLVNGSTANDLALYHNAGSEWVPVAGSNEAVVARPNAHIPASTLSDTDTAEIAVPIAAGGRIDVYRWGGWELTNHTAPTGLAVELLNPDETVAASEETVNTTDATGIASYENTSSGVEVPTLRLNNGTGSEIDAQALFAYRVSD